MDHGDDRSLAGPRRFPIPRLSLMASGGTETLFDSILLSPDRLSLDAYAPQALNLLNSPFAIKTARSLAERAVQEAGTDDTKRIVRAIWLTLSREPRKKELVACGTLLAEHTQLHLKQADATIDAASHSAMVDLCRMLLNVNEFAYID